MNIISPLLHIVGGIELGPRVHAADALPSFRLRWWLRILRCFLLRRASQRVQVLSQLLYIFGGIELGPREHAVVALPSFQLRIDNAHFNNLPSPSGLMRRPSTRAVVALPSF